MVKLKFLFLGGGCNAIIEIRFGKKFPRLYSLLAISFFPKKRKLCNTYFSQMRKEEEIDIFFHRIFQNNFYFLESSMRGWTIKKLKMVLETSTRGWTIKNSIIIYLLTNNKEIFFSFSKNLILHNQLITNAKTFSDSHARTLFIFFVSRFKYENSRNSRSSVLKNLGKNIDRKALVPYCRPSQSSC